MITTLAQSWVASRGTSARCALIAIALAAGCSPAMADHESSIDHAVDITGHDIRDTEYCAAHEGECGRDPTARVRFKAARVLLCPESSLLVTPRPDITDISLGHTHGRDFRSWWPEGEIGRVRDPNDRGAVMQVQGCTRNVLFTCFRAHVTVREPATPKDMAVAYDDPAALDCVRWAPWDPAP